MSSPRQAVAVSAPAVHPALLGLALVLLAVNLRTTVGSLPPLLAGIERDLGLSGATAGLLTALPVLCMALCAPGAHRVAHRFGREATALGSVVLVAVGNSLRLAGTHSAVLFGATLLAGLGIAACGVVLPGIVKEFFPSREGAASSAYTVAMMLGAAAAGALAVPIEQLLGSWSASLAVWGLPACLAVAVWIPVTSRLNTPEGGEESHPGRLPWRSRGALLLAAFMSAQAALAYAYMAWLSPAYESHGWSPGNAGLLLGLFNLMQFVTALALPTLADRSKDRRPAILASVALTLTGAVWLWALPDLLPWLAVCVVGLGIGGGFSLGVVLIVDYASDPGSSGRLAALVFLICYSAAAITPVVVGALRDSSGGFVLPFGVLTAIAAIQLLLATRLGPAYRGSVR